MTDAPLTRTAWESPPPPRGRPRIYSRSKKRTRVPSHITRLGLSVVAATGPSRTGASVHPNSRAAEGSLEPGN